MTEIEYLATCALQNIATDNIHIVCDITIKSIKKNILFCRSTVPKVCSTKYMKI